MENLHLLEYMDIKSVLTQLLKYTRMITNSDAGTIYIKEGNYLKFIIAQNDTINSEVIKNKFFNMENIKLPLVPQKLNFVAVQSFNQQKIINIKNVYKNQKFNLNGVKEFDKLFDYQTLSIVTFPLVHPAKKEMIGVLQIINKKSEKGFTNYTQKDIKLLSSMSLFTGFLVSELQKDRVKIDKTVSYENQTVTPKIIVRDFFYDFQTKEWSKGGKIIHLSRGETKFMEILMTNRGKVFSMQELEWQISPFKMLTGTSIKNFAFKIRKKLSPDVIKTIGALGYMVE